MTASSLHVLLLQVSRLSLPPVPPGYRPVQGSGVLECLQSGMVTVNSIAYLPQYALDALVFPRVAPGYAGSVLLQYSDIDAVEDQPQASGVCSSCCSFGDATTLASSVSNDDPNALGPAGAEGQGSNPPSCTLKVLLPQRSCRNDLRR
jgi:hypothetical protein